LLLAPGVVFIFVVGWFFSPTTISELAQSLNRFLNVSIWLTVGIFLSGAFAIRSYYSGGGARGALGGIWDILTYWPRFYHPFSPPSYTVRAVPELNARITWLIENGGSQASGKVLASAHSQGVPTTLAALSLMEAENHRRNVALLTYGCPTGLLYAAVFPDYFGPNQMDAFATRWMREDENSKVRWVNLWRLTDWTGGYVKAGKRDRYFERRTRFRRGEPTQREMVALDSRSFCELRLTDPDPDLIARDPFSNRPDVVLLRSDPIPGPYGHDETGYLHEREYADARKVLAQALYSSFAPPGAMSTTSTQNIRLRTDQDVTKLQRFDIVAIHDPPTAPEPNPEPVEAFAQFEAVARIIALPSETVEGKADGLLVNGEKIDDGAFVKDGEYGSPFGPITLTDDQYFIMTDNRKVGQEFRISRAISADLIVGSITIE
jgi:hypothetical protein